MTKQKQSSDTDTDAQRTSRRGVGFGVTTVITLTLVVGVVLAASISPVGVVAAATDFSVTTTAPETVSPDETIDITYTIENTGDTDLESLALSGTPQTSDTELTITDAASDSAATITEDNRIIFETVAPGASVTATLTVAVGTDATGTESLTAETTNGFGESEVSKQTVTDLTVTTENTPPTANDVSVSTSEDTSVTEPFDASDPDGDPLSYSVESSPDHGTVSTSGNSFTYTPDSDYSGSDSFTYEVSDGNGGTDTATVSISVKDETENDEYEPNDRFDTAASITEGTYSSLQIVDVENDFFAVTLEDSDSINSSVIFDDSIGDLAMILYGPDNQIMNFSVSPSAGELVSAAEANEDGTYYIRIYGRDPGASPSYDLDVDISGGDGNDPPIATDMSVSISEDTSVTETFDASDPDGDSLSYSVVLSPDHGTVSTSGDSFTYTPDSDYSGSDSFTYEVSDGNGGQDTDTVEVRVTDTENTGFIVGDIARSDGSEIENVEQLEIQLFREGVEVTGDPPNSPVQADANGEYVAEVPVEGNQTEYRVEVSSPRFVEFAREVTIQPQATERVDIRLQESSTSTSAIDATRSLTSTEVTNGSTVTVTVEANFERSVDDATLVDKINGQGISADNLTITDADGGFSAVSEYPAVDVTRVYDDELNVGLGGESLTVEYELTIPEDTPVGTTITFDGDVTNSATSETAGIDGDSSVEVVATTGPDTDTDTVTVGGQEVPTEFTSETNNGDRTVTADNAVEAINTFIGGDVSADVAVDVINAFIAS